MRTDIEAQIRCIKRVSAREWTRACEEFETRHGRPYDSFREDDFDNFPKDYMLLARVLETLEEIAPHAAEPMD